MNRALRGIVAACCAAAALCAAASVTRTRATDSGGAAIYLDGVEIAGSAAIFGGTHTVTARTDSELACIVLYENRRFVTASFSGSLEYDFPESGAEIALFCLDRQFRPSRGAVRVTQSAVSGKLLYSGQAVCYDLYNGDYPEFDDYTVRLNVVTENGRITRIREIAGYRLNTETPTDDVNASLLARAANVMPDRIIRAQSAEIPDAVTGATCSSDAIARAVRDALTHTPEPYDDSGEEETSPVADGVYSGSAHCLSGHINYMVDVDVTVQDGVVTEIQDRTLTTPMSANDKLLYSVAWRNASRQIAQARMSADAFASVDGVTGATVSSAGINAAVRNALTARSPVQEESGDVYAPEGISLYSRAYPVVTVLDGRIARIRIVPAEDSDAERLEAFAAEIARRQSVNGLEWPDGIQDDAFSIANLAEQILYGTGVLQ